MEGSIPKVQHEYFVIKFQCKSSENIFWNQQ